MFYGISGEKMDLPMVILQRFHAMAELIRDGEEKKELIGKMSEEVSHNDLNLC